MVFSKDHYAERRARKNAAKAETEEAAVEPVEEAVVEDAPAVCTRCGTKAAVAGIDHCVDCMD